MKLFGRYFYRTTLGLAQVFDAKTPGGSAVRVLKLGGVWQSATYLGTRQFEPVFAYYRAFDIAFDATEKNRGPQRATRVLMLGGGGFAWPKHVLATRPGVRLDVVEVDPAIVGIARRHFFLNDAVAQFDPNHARIRIIYADGRAYLESLAHGTPPVKNKAPILSEHAGNSKTHLLSRGFGGDAQTPRSTEHVPASNPPLPYDVIVNDTFSGAEPVRSLATIEAAQAIKACLEPGGLYLSNVVSQEEGFDVSFLRDAVATLERVFRHVQVIPCADEEFGGEDNYLVAASDVPHAFADAIPFDQEFLGNVMHD